MHEKLNNNLEFFAKHCLKIKPKEGDVKPFIFNKAQKYLHYRLEQQLAKTGRVRALILKGRQQGCSTYVAARFYHKATRQKGKSVYILSHEAATTTKLFNIVKRYHEYIPEVARPETEKCNDRSIIFSVNSEYTVGTAGNKNTGRGGTVQLFHGCVHEDSLVVLADGSTKTMRDIEEGDLVITSSGRVAPVTLKTNTGVKQTYEIKTWLTNESIKVSKDHKILTQRGWVKTEDISKDDYIRLPEFTLNNARKFYDFTLKNLPKKQNQGTRHREYARVPLDYNFGYLLGYYLAEGHLKKQSKEPRRLCHVQFACHENENFFENIRPLVEEFSTSVKEKVTPGTHRKTITCYGTFLAEMVSSICGRVESKHVPSWFFNTNKEFLTGVLRGYFDGDGSKTDDTRTRATCVRERIIRQMRRIALALKLGVPGLSYHNNRRRYDKDTEPAFVMSLNGFSNRRFNGEDIPFEHFEKNSKYKRIDGKWYVKIKSITPADVATTYDIEVGHNDHDFDTPIGIISNSEVGFYENTDELQTGLLQSIADMPGTEIILESTANGMGNFFHRMCMGAMKGENDYELIFIPWFWQDEYYKEPPSDFQLTDDEKVLKATYELSDGQIYWRRLKIASLTGGEWKFKQEYPCTPDEAFQVSGNSMISSEAVMAARKRPLYPHEHAAVIGACDSARSGDRIPRMIRQGRNIINYEVHCPLTDGVMTTTQLAGLIAKDIVQFNVDAYFVDCTNGWGVVDLLHDMGFKHVVRGVVFSETKSLLEPNRFVNKRSEMMVAVRDWFETDEPSIPDDDALHVDITSIPEPKETAAGKLYIVPKDKIKEQLGMSPDLMDTLALTFAFPVRYNGGSKTIQKKDANKVTKKSSSLKTFRRVSQRASNTNQVTRINIFGG